MSALPDLFPGFAQRRIETTDGVQINVRTGGSGPPLLLLHGYPQTHAMWHKVAPDLAARFTLVIADLRGYGDSSAPMGDEARETYAKRTMAQDALLLMRELDHRRFTVAGHDRGGRVAYRLALDHPDAVSALVALDIIPTAEVWRRITAEAAIRGYHWQFLAQPFPLPETLIGKDPIYYLEHTLASWTGTHDLSPFSPGALAHYHAQVRDPARVHAFCEDYRAGAGIDRRLDEADFAAGRRIACPTLVLHGRHLPTGPAGGNPLDIWRGCCTNVSAAPIASGHFLAEENPADTLAALVPFLAASSGAS
jgi:haloacetate dehalogenase